MMVLLREGTVLDGVVMGNGLGDGDGCVGDG